MWAGDASNIPKLRRQTFETVIVERYRRRERKIYAQIEAWRNRRIEDEHPYLYLDGIVTKRSWASEVRTLLVASALNSEGFREILGICEGAKEDKSGWSAFLRHLIDRGLHGVQLMISDAPLAVLVAPV